MFSLWERLRIEGGEARLRSDPGWEVARLLERMTSAGPGEAPDLPAADLVAALAYAGLGPPEGLGPPLVRQPPPRPRLEAALSEPAIHRMFPGASRPARLALAAGLLQIHDFWDASHQAAQLADDLGERDVSAYWHGIAHRREPDPGNAAYWFRRVGRHPLLPALAEAARPVMEESNDAGWARRLLGAAGWNPTAMIDLCTGARPGSRESELARRLQRLEMSLLLDATAALLFPPSEAEAGVIDSLPERP